MRTLWRGLVRIVFWSFERGTWPYDVAVALIVVFVLLSPRGWFNDRPPLDTQPPPPMVELQVTDPASGLETYRVDARLLSHGGESSEREIEHQLRDVVGKSAKRPRNSFQIVRIAPIRERNGAIAFYDVSIKP